MAIQIRNRVAHVLSVAALAAVSTVTFVRLSEPPKSSDPHARLSGAALSGTTATPVPSPALGGVSEQFHSEVAELERQLAAAPDDLTVLGRLAVMYRSAHQPARAAAYYERYLVLDPTNRQMQLDLAQSYAALRRWSDALEVSLSLLAMDPDDPVAVYNVGAIHANRGDFGEARVWWEKASRQQVDKPLAAKARESLESISSLEK